MIIIIYYVVIYRYNTANSPVFGWSAFSSTVDTENTLHMKKPFTIRIKYDKIDVWHMNSVKLSGFILNPLKL